MDIIFTDLLESLINDDGSPRLPRCIVVGALTGFIAFVGIMVGINSEGWIGRLVGFVPSAAVIALGVYLIVRICKKPKKV